MTEPAAHRPQWDTDDLPQGEEKVAAVQGMFDAIAPKYDRLNRVISFRRAVRWRKRAVRDLALPAGSVVLDLATDATVRYQIVGEDEASVKENRISVTSPIARSLVGKEVGDVVTVKTPGGEVEYEIAEILHL